MGSVLVITMSFHSRGILDVGAPVREVEWSGIRFPHEGSQQIRWVVQGRRYCIIASLSSAVLRRLGEVRLASEQDRLCCGSGPEQTL
jgi:hypothetical protein